MILYFVDKRCIGDKRESRCLVAMMYTGNDPSMQWFVKALMFTGNDVSKQLCSQAAINSSHNILDSAPSSIWYILAEQTMYTTLLASENTGTTPKSSI